VPRTVTTHRQEAGIKAVIGLPRSIAKDNCQRPNPDGTGLSNATTGWDFLLMKSDGLGKQYLLSCTMPVVMQNSTTGLNRVEYADDMESVEFR
jgi:hypothetical protein